MPNWDAIAWRLTGDPLKSGARAALLERAHEDAQALGLDPQEYRRWLEAATEDEPSAGQCRASLADAALAAGSLEHHTEALLSVSHARRLHVPAFAEPLARWSDAELRVTIAVAQRRFDDPSSPRNRLASLGKAAGTLGHELRNPIGVIQSSVYLLRRTQDEKKVQRHIEKIGRQARDCHRIIEDLMHLARNAPPRLESVDVSQAFSLALTEAALPAEVTCRNDVPEGVRVQADGGLLQRALVNVLRNASTAMRGAGELHLGADASEDELTLWVRDHGPGFESHLLHAAFDPLATTEGVGLGLALVDSVTRRHGGRASAHNPPGGGARVSLHFPRSVPGSGSRRV